MVWLCCFCSPVYEVFCLFFYHSVYHFIWWSLKSAASVTQRKKEIVFISYSAQFLLLFPYLRTLICSFQGSSNTFYYCCSISTRGHASKWHKMKRKICAITPPMGEKYTCYTVHPRSQGSVCENNTVSKFIHSPRLLNWSRDSVKFFLGS